jgi:hypothetical protein
MSTHKPGLASNPVAERRSRLPGLVQATDTPQQNTEAGAGQGSGGTAAETGRKATSSTTKLKNGKTKQSVYLLNSTIEDLKNAAEALAGAPGAPRGLSDLADAAIQYYVGHLQTKYNDGKPFPPRTGPLQRGPRIH